MQSDKKQFHLRLIPTGGITPKKVHDYISARAWAVGVGKELIKQDALTSGGLDRLRSRAAAFVAAMVKAKGTNGAC